MYDEWIELFSAVNPLKFQGLGCNAILNLIEPGNKREYTFEVRHVLVRDEVDFERNACNNNGAVGMKPGGAIVGILIIQMFLVFYFL